MDKEGCHRIRGCRCIALRRREWSYHSSSLGVTPCFRALADAALTTLAANLVTSFVYSHDVISRLLLGSVRDLKNAALWLCETEREGGEGCSAVTTRVKRWTAGVGEMEDSRWVGCFSFLLLILVNQGLQFIAVWKTLEANMQMSNMFPPAGTRRMLWAMRDSDLHGLRTGLRRLLIHSLRLCRPLLRVLVKR